MWYGSIANMVTTHDELILTGCAYRPPSGSNDEKILRSIRRVNEIMYESKFNGLWGS